MTQFTKTISNRVVLLAGDPTSKWGIMVWGVDMWATTGDEVQEIGKVIDDSQGFTDGLVKQPSYVLGDSVSVSSDIVMAELIDQAGYSKIFLGDTTDGAAQGSTTWTQSPAASTSWSSASSPTTSWSQE